MRTAWLDLILNMLSKKKGNFLFKSFPVAVVALFTERRPSENLNILSEMGRIFLFSSFPVAVVSLSSSKFVMLKL